MGQLQADEITSAKYGLRVKLALSCVSKIRNKEEERSKRLRIWLKIQIQSLRLSSFSSKLLLSFLTL